MRRPSPGGLLIAVALSIPVLVEARTLLVWFGYEVPLQVYVPVAVGLVLLVAATVWFAGDEGNPSRA